MSDDSNYGGFDDITNEPVVQRDDATVDFGDEFGVVRFADDEISEPAISFKDNPTGQLPHWTEPATGELPKFVTISQDAGGSSGGIQRQRVDLTGQSGRTNQIVPPPVARPQHQGRVSIDSSQSGGQVRPDISQGVSRPKQVRRARSEDRSQVGNSARPSAKSQAQNDNGDRSYKSPARDLPTATAVGVLLGAVYIATTIAGPLAVMVLLVIVLALAAIEFFTQTTSTGYQPSMVVGVIGCVAAPIVAYWIGDAALPLVLMFAFLATAISFIGTSSVESGPVPNIGLTMLGLVWIGLFGSYGALILRMSNLGAGLENVGTDTLFIIVIGIIANDVAAYFVGSMTGRTPLRVWISPGKTMEGFVGGLIGTFASVIIVGMQSETWDKLSHQLIIALVISVVGPIGDLTASMFKRNMDIKDFGTILRGHGGILDRFDAMLFALPVVYYVTLVLAPWAS